MLYHVKYISILTPILPLAANGNFEMTLRKRRYGNIRKVRIKQYSRLLTVLGALI